MYNTLTYYKTTTLCLVVFLFSIHSYAAPQFQFNKPCVAAYHEIICLRLAEANKILLKEKKDNPDNLIPIYLDNYIDFLELFCSEDYSMYKKLVANEEKRIKLVQSGQQQNEYYYFTQAEIYIQWAVMKMKFGEFVSAIIDIRKANQLLIKGASEHQSSYVIKKSKAMLQCLFGSIPDSYKWGGNLLGLTGDITSGTATLKQLLSTKNEIFHDETLMIYALIQYHLNNNKNGAWAILKENGYPKQNNLLSYYIYAYIGTYGGYSNEAIIAMQQAPKSLNYTSMPILEYLMGLCKLYSLDKTAGAHFDAFLRNSKSKNYKKAALQKQAWLQLLFSGPLSYKSRINLIPNIGVDVIDADKQAQKEATSGRVPDVRLLKIRLLCDGSYFEKAGAILHNVKESDFTTVYDKLEFLYRKARWYHLTNDTANAIIAYKLIYSKGKDQPFYFAANAALQLGYLFEMKGNKTEAIQYYKLCISLKNHEYVNSLSQKAKSGLNRLELKK